MASWRRCLPPAPDAPGDRRRGTPIQFLTLVKRRAARRRPGFPDHDNLVTDCGRSCPRYNQGKVFFSFGVWQSCGRAVFLRAVIMKRVLFGAALLLGGCSAHDSAQGGASFNERLYKFANAGMVRVGDYGALTASQVHSPRECAALTRPGAQMTQSSYDTLRSLCIKDVAFSAEVSALD